MSACAKCGAALGAEASACARCGLARDRMAAYAASADEAVPAEVRAAWTAATAAWGEPARHETFLRVATDARAFAWAARQYRQASADRPADPTAAAMLQRLARTAEVVTLAGGGGKVRPRAPYRGAMLLLALGAIILVIGALFIRRIAPGRSGRSAAGSAASPGSAAPAPGLLVPSDFGRRIPVSPPPPSGPQAAPK